MDIQSLIRKIPDYPRPGETYYDLTTLLADGRGFRAVIEELATRYASRSIKKFACLCENNSSKKMEFSTREISKYSLSFNI